MKEIDKLLHDTVEIQRIRKIKTIYKDLEEKQKKFAKIFNVSCLKGCGSCCEHFNPDITEVEALFVAYGLISEKKEKEVLEKLEKSEKGYCPLYNKDDLEHHCTIYKYRPLICRLFGFSSTLDKEQKPVYRACKYNNQACDISTCNMLMHPESLVIMKDYGIMVEELDTNNTKTELVQTALKKAIEKIQLLMELNCL